MDPSRVAVVIEDDPDICELVRNVMAQSGFEVHTAENGVAGVAAVKEHRPSIVTLDVGLPDIDGFETARQIRLFSDAYILMLTARAEEIDAVLGFKSGADDYIIKPFRTFELRARVTAMLRRSRISESIHGAGSPPTEAEAANVGAPGALEDFAGLPARAPQTAAAAAVRNMAAPSAHGVEEPERPAATYVHNGLCLDYPTRTVTADGAPTQLTRMEFDLLCALMESGRNVRSKHDLVRRLRYEDYETGSFISAADERAIEVHMANLRRKLGDDPRSPKWLETVRGFGYRMAAANSP